MGFIDMFLSWLAGSWSYLGVGVVRGVPGLKWGSVNGPSEVDIKVLLGLVHLVGRCLVGRTPCTHAREIHVLGHGCTPRKGSVCVFLSVYFSFLPFTFLFHLLDFYYLFRSCFLLVSFASFCFLLLSPVFPLFSSRSQSRAPLLSAFFRPPTTQAPITRRVVCPLAASADHLSSFRVATQTHLSRILFLNASDTRPTGIWRLTTPEARHVIRLPVKRKETREK